MGRIVVMTCRPQLTMADKDDDKKDEILPVGPGADDEASDRGSQGDDNPDQGYQYADERDEDAPARGEARAGHTEDDLDDEPDDGSGLTREQRRRRRRKERHERDQRELALLRTRNEQLEREHSARLAAMESRQSQSDVLAIDSRITQAESDVREAEELLRQAMEKGDSASAVEALRVRDQFREGLGQLRGAKQRTLNAARTRQAEGAQPQGPDSASLTRAQTWTREHPWFDPNLGDEDSAIAQAIERQVYREGRLNARSDEYWDEVDRRLAKRLPERYANHRDEDDEDDDEGTRSSRREPARRVNGNGRRKPSGPTIKVGGRERTLRKGEVYIDEDRKAAMVEAGVWDDPKERERFMRSYQRYDRDAGRRPR